MIRNRGMRTEVELAVDALADRQLQRRCWTVFEPEEGSESFDLVVHVLYDDTVVAADPVREIGLVLRDQDEVDAMVPLTAALDAFLRASPGGPKTTAQLDSPEWQRVVARAEAAKAVLSR